MIKSTSPVCLSDFTDISFPEPFSPYSTAKVEEFRGDIITTLEQISTKHNQSFGKAIIEASIELMKLQDSDEPQSLKQRLNSLSDDELISLYHIVSESFALALKNALSERPDLSFSSFLSFKTSGVSEEVLSSWRFDRLNFLIGSDIVSEFEVGDSTYGTKTLFVINHKLASEITGISDESKYDIEARIVTSDGFLSSTAFFKIDTCKSKSGEEIAIAKLVNNEGNIQEIDTAFSQAQVLDVRWIKNISSENLGRLHPGVLEDLNKALEELEEPGLWTSANEKKNKHDAICRAARILEHMEMLIHPTYDLPSSHLHAAGGWVLGTPRLKLFRADPSKLLNKAKAVISEVLIGQRLALVETDWLVFEPSSTDTFRSNPFALALESDNLEITKNDVSFTIVPAMEGFFIGDSRSIINYYREKCSTPHYGVLSVSFEEFDLIPNGPSFSNGDVQYYPYKITFVEIPAQNIVGIKLDLPEKKLDSPTFRVTISGDASKVIQRKIKRDIQYNESRVDRMIEDYGEEIIHCYAEILGIKSKEEHLPLPDLRTKLAAHHYFRKDPNQPRGHHDSKFTLEKDSEGLRKIEYLSFFSGGPLSGRGEYVRYEEQPTGEWKKVKALRKGIFIS